MRVTNGAPVQRAKKPGRLKLQHAAKPERVVNRAPWQPNNAKRVLLVCGHVTLSDLLIKTLRPLLDTPGEGGAVYCQNCEAWIPVFREATASEIAGIDTSQLYAGELPPF